MVCVLCLTLYQPMDCSLPVSSVHGIFQARILEWVSISYSMGSSQPRNWTRVSWGFCIGRQILYHWSHLADAASQIFLVSAVKDDAVSPALLLTLQKLETVINIWRRYCLPVTVSSKLRSSVLGLCSAWKLQQIAAKVMRDGPGSPRGWTRMEN